MKKIFDKHGLVEDGLKRDINANHTFRGKVAKEIYDKYAKELQESGYFKKLFLNYKIKRKIRKILQERFSIDNMYLKNK